MITNIIAIYFYASVILLALEVVYPLEKRSSFFRSGMITDAVYWLITPVTTSFVRTAGLWISTVVIFRESPDLLRMGFETRRTWMLDQPQWFQIIALLLTADFIYYWAHRLSHKGKLWKYHITHHSSQTMDWLAGVREHPLYDTLYRWLQVTFLLFFGFNPDAIAVYLPISVVYTIFLHSNISWNFGGLNHIIATPQYHRWHHTCEVQGMNQNFAGMFPFIDRIFGTHYLPTEIDIDKSIYGVRNETAPEDFVEQVLFPFHKDDSLPPPTIKKK